MNGRAQNREAARRPVSGRQTHAVPAGDHDPAPLWIMIGPDSDGRLPGCGDPGAVRATLLKREDEGAAVVSALNPADGDRASVRARLEPDAGDWCGPAGD